MFHAKFNLTHVYTWGHPYRTSAQGGPGEGGLKANADIRKILKIVKLKRIY